jgi:hypothetical protein
MVNSLLLSFARDGNKTGIAKATHKYDREKRLTQ